MQNKNPILPKEVVSAFVRIGYDKEEIEDISSIDHSTSCVDNLSKVTYINYALYYIDDSDDIIEVTVRNDNYLIEYNGGMIASGDCTYDFDVEAEDISGQYIQID